MIKKVDTKVLKWLTNCPASDINWKNNLLLANIETLNEALKCNSLSKTAQKKMEARVRRLLKNG